MAPSRSNEPGADEGTESDLALSPPETEAAAPIAGADGGGDAALWRALLSGDDVDQFLRSFVHLAAGQLGRGLRQLAILYRRAGGTLAEASWPEGSSARDLGELTEAAFRDGRPLLRQSGRGARVLRHIAAPIQLDGATVAVAIAVFTVEAAEGPQGAAEQLRRLQWGLGWVQQRLGQGASSVALVERDRSRMTLDLLATVLDRGDYRGAALAAVTEMALAFACSRVSLGFRRFGSTRVEAISHSSSFSRRVQLVQQIGRAMDEAIDQRSVIRYPAEPDDIVFTTAHATLAGDAKSGAVLTIPLLIVDAYIGAITFERPPERPFDAETIALLTVVATALGPVLNEKRRNDRWLIVKIGESLVTQAARLLGPGYLGRKAIALAALVIVVGLSFWSETYHVVADAQLEPLERRVVVSAYDGYVQSAKARAGDLVKAGDELATLEDRELNLERLRWVTERQQHQYEYDRALATRELANINIVKTQIEQADAQIKLIDEQIARTRLTAPFDGLVVSGDLSQRIGASVSRGETLFQLSPLSKYRVVATVSERDIASLAPGQEGEVVFASLPDQPIPIRIDRITPVASDTANGTGFRVEASLDGANDRLRPGMTGVARIGLDREPVIAIWTRPMLDWLGLLWWRLVP